MSPSGEGLLLMNIGKGYWIRLLLAAADIQIASL